MKEKKEKIYLPTSIKNIETKFGSMMVANFKVEDYNLMQRMVGYQWS